MKLGISHPFPAQVIDHSIFWLQEKKSCRALEIPEFLRSLFSKLAVLDKGDEYKLIFGESLAYAAEKGADASDVPDLVRKASKELAAYVAGRAGFWDRLPWSLVNLVDPNDDHRQGYAAELVNARETLDAGVLKKMDFGGILSDENLWRQVKWLAETGSVSPELRTAVERYFVAVPVATPADEVNVKHMRGVHANTIRAGSLAGALRSKSNTFVPDQALERHVPEARQLEAQRAADVAAAKEARRAEVQAVAAEATAARPDSFEAACRDDLELCRAMAEAYRSKAAERTVRSDAAQGRRDAATLGQAPAPRAAGATAAGAPARVDEKTCEAPVLLNGAVVALAGAVGTVSTTQSTGGPAAYEPIVRALKGVVRNCVDAPLFYLDAPLSLRMSNLLNGVVAALAEAVGTVSTTQSTGGPAADEAIVRPLEAAVRNGVAAPLSLRIRCPCCAKTYGPGQYGRLPQHVRQHVGKEIAKLLPMLDGFYSPDIYDALGLPPNGDYCRGGLVVPDAEELEGFMEGVNDCDDAKAQWAAVQRAFSAYMVVVAAADADVSAKEKEAKKAADLRQGYCAASNDSVGSAAGRANAKALHLGGSPTESRPDPVDDEAPTDDEAPPPLEAPGPREAPAPLLGGAP